MGDVRDILPSSLSSLSSLDSWMNQCPFLCLMRRKFCTLTNKTDQALAVTLHRHSNAWSVIISKTYQFSGWTHLNLRVFLSRVSSRYSYKTASWIARMNRLKGTAQCQQWEKCTSAIRGRLPYPPCAERTAPESNWQKRTVLRKSESSEWSRLNQRYSGKGGSVPRVEDGCFLKKWE